ncbi:PIG-L family deacetylase [Kutzneria sp. NPDC052558]|uniref:PIG-L family deacetylase n=1 Tax=Kutzneria sp. NPDC052558 TaxID=3364121 RepID=UPI0037CA4B62
MVGLLATGSLLGTTLQGVALSPVAAAALPPFGRYMQIVAHQDDDLLFMNPDLKDTVNAGRPTTTVYVTAGEEDRDPAGELRDIDKNDCANDLGNTGRPGKVKLDREDYAGCRALGAMAAWAGIAGASNPDDPGLWDRQAITIGFGDGDSRQVEEDTLRTNNNIKLVFMNLPEAGDQTHPDIRPGDSRQGDNLTHVVYDGATRRTVLSSMSQVTEPQDYDLDAVQGVLRGLINRYNPTVIRAQDPTADFRYAADNPDHLVVAQLVGRLVRAIPASERLLQLVNYRDYNISDSQVNLDLSQRDDKKATFHLYSDYDMNIDDIPAYPQWTQRTYHRYWTGTNYAALNADGRFQVVAALNGQVFTWAQRQGDLKWVGPNPLAAGDITRVLPGLSIVSNPTDGTLQVFGVDADSGDIITTWQDKPNGAWSNRWVSLGNPNAGSDTANQVGYPAVTRNANGQLAVFVKNGGGGISWKKQSGSHEHFETLWTDLQGSPNGIQDGLSAVTHPDGRMEVFAYSIVNGVGKISLWYQHDPQDNFNGYQPSLTAFEPASPPTVAVNNDGRLDVFYRMANNSDTQPVGSYVAHTYQLTGGDWTTQPDNIRGDNGFGPVAAGSAPPTAAGGDARIFVFERNRNGGVSGTKQTVKDGAYNTQWANFGNFISTQPAALAGPDGRMAVFAQADDGSMTMSQQTASGGANGFGDWQTLDG